MNSHKLIRITTVPISLEKLLSGQMRFMKENGFDVYMVSSPNKKSLALEQKENASYLTVNMTRVISPFKDLISLMEMIKLLRKIKPSIVHTHTPKAGLIGMLASWITNVPIRLHTVAGLPLMEVRGTKRKILEIVEKITYYCATFVYPNSSNLKNFILKLKLTNKNKIAVIGNGSSNGIDIHAFKRTEEIEQVAISLMATHQLSVNHFIFVFVGRLVKDKGIEELIGAFKRLNIQYPILKLMLVGPEEPELDPLSEECINEIHHNEAIIHVGYQQEVRSYLALSNALVFPSYREGFPNVPMQAGCFGLPSIVTNINGCNEIIIEGENGLIVPVKDENALFVAMKTLYLDKNIYQKMAQNSRKMIVDRYEQQKVWDLILEEYKKHLNHHVIL